MEHGAEVSERDVDVAPVVEPDGDGDAVVGSAVAARVGACATSCKRGRGVNVGRRVRGGFPEG